MASSGDPATDVAPRARSLAGFGERRTGNAPARAANALKFRGISGLFIQLAYGFDSPPIHCERLILEALEKRRNAGAARLRSERTFPVKETAMLHYAIVFLVIALIAAVLGFGGIAGAAAGIAKILFLVFLVLFIVSLFMGRRSPRV
jgi:uncharacterized membrane protein YtjA (UPF0391 family)